MNTRTLITVILALHADGQDTDAILATVERMGGIDTQPMPQTPQAPQSQAPRFSGGSKPSVKYQLASGWNAKRLSDELTGRKLQVATVVLAHGQHGATKREVLQRIAVDEPTVTNGAIMSAIHPLVERKILLSVPIHEAPKPQPSTTIRRPLR